MDKDYLKRKLRGCLLGRGVGEALGRPFTGMNDPMDLVFYDPVPSKDGVLCTLDFQLLWLEVLKSLPGGPVADRDLFVQCWLDHVRYSEDEYAVALRNLKNNIMPPWSGSFDNFYCDGFGAAQRAGLWAWLAPAKCELAAQLAYEDACVDHDSDGIYAALFLAAFERAAFIEKDMNTLLEIAGRYLQKVSRLAGVLADVRSLCAEKKDWREVRAALLAKYECENLTDSVMNFGFIIAMALICNPELIIADEPTTALDVTIQAQILDLLREIKNKINGSIMLITHDLGVIAEMADYVVVMYAGKVIERGTALEIFQNPLHPYTMGLQKSKPAVNKKVERLYNIPGQVPNPVNMPSYCYFKDRCDKCIGKCNGEYPPMIQVTPTHSVSCYLYNENKKEGE